MPTNELNGGTGPHARTYVAATIWPSDEGNSRTSSGEHRTHPAGITPANATTSREAALLAQTFALFFKTIVPSY